MRFWFAALALVLVHPVAAQSVSPWPEYRGPSADGQVVGSLPLTWAEDRGVTWKVPVPGRGWSSPVISAGRVWLTTAPPTGEHMRVLAYDLESGEELLSQVLFTVKDPEPVNRLNSYASPSPVASGKHVYVHYGTYGTACLESASGEVVWSRDDLTCDHMEGPGSSPLLLKDRLILNMDGGDVQYVVALDAKTGKTLWRTERSIELEGLEPDLRKAYSTPVLATVDGQPQLVSSGAQATYGYDPASGKELWRVHHKGFSMSSRPMLVGDRVVLSTGFMRPELWCVRLGGKGDISESHMVWRNTRGAPTMPSNVVVDGLLFQSSDRGMASCVDLEDGETLWQERLGADVCASPIVSAGRVYFFDRDGKATVIESSAKFKQLAINQLDDGCMASPAVVGDALILRTETHLYRIEEPR